MDLKDIGKIISHVGEHRFLENFSKLEGIVIIANTNEILTIKEMLGPNSSRSYIERDRVLENADILSCAGAIKVSAIVVVSFIDEGALYNEVVSAIGYSYKDIRILRLFADVFVNFIAVRGGVDPLIDESVPTLSYAIITTPRSGSTYFCNLLQSTGIVGYPAEHLRQASVTLALSCKFDYMAALIKVMGSRVSRNNVFGTKLLSHFLYDFQQAGYGFERIFDGLFQKFIYLKRNDRVMQSVSAALAQQTSIWHVYNDIKHVEYYKQIEKIVLEDAFLAKVNNLYMDINWQYEYLNRILEAYSIEPLVVEYEQLIDTPAESVRSVLSYLGVDGDNIKLNNIRAATKVLRSDLSEQISELFKRKYLPKRTSFIGEKYDGLHADVNELLLQGRALVRREKIVEASYCFKAAYNLASSVSLSLQERDVEIVDYKSCLIENGKTGRKLSIRGGGAIEDGDKYFACIGQEFTYGRFVDKPYPKILADKLSIKCINLGILGGNPSLFVDQNSRFLIDICNKSEFVVVLLMSGLALGKKSDEIALNRSEIDIYDGYNKLFVDNVDGFYDLYNEIKENYIEKYIYMAMLIKKPKILLWFSGKRNQSSGHMFRDGVHSFPEFVCGDVVGRIKPFYDYYVESSSRRGLPQRLISRITGLPCSNCEGIEYNVKYPTPEMHCDVADLLLPVCNEILSIN